jgi:hypothetical protein
MEGGATVEEMIQVGMIKLMTWSLALEPPSWTPFKIVSKNTE